MTFYHWKKSPYLWYYPTSSEFCFCKYRLMVTSTNLVDKYLINIACVRSCKSGEIVLSVSAPSWCGVFPQESWENNSAISSQLWKSPFVIAAPDERVKTLSEPEKSGAVTFRQTCTKVNAHVDSSNLKKSNYTLLNRHPHISLHYLAPAIIMFILLTSAFFPLPAVLPLKETTSYLNPPWKTMLHLLLPAVLAVQAMGEFGLCLWPAIRSKSSRWECHCLLDNTACWVF